MLEFHKDKIINTQTGITIIIIYDGHITNLPLYTVEGRYTRERTIAIAWSYDTSKRNLIK